ncbi:Predicted acetyltransferase [Gracilibacillus orientalis]|uniref:Predicted acetyltransferase n=1 Tax=Gracilibacillus orientalis TaxID=334253 RepID=A0A1I4RG75_9BACI|nr:GNAT family N-acetyltransferase [Gracilibacillus orientalis]SFM50953.1 Predicted acetyltransferase [Gracilibacillus orientalis]
MSDKMRKLAREDNPEIFKLSQFAFQYSLSQEELIEQEEEAAHHEIWGCFEEEQLSAKVHMIPLNVNINGKAMKMGGIAAVASWPEYRRSGKIKRLLQEVLRSMKSTGHTISYLHPFSVPFYRKYGYELTFNQRKYQIPMDSLKKKWKASGYARRNKNNYEDLQKVYSAYISAFNGALIRDKKWWNQRIIKKDTMTTICYNEQNEAEGYLLYHVKNQILHVEELAYVNLNGLKLILQLISNHDSMATKVEMTVPDNDHLPMLIDEPRYEQKVVPYFMSRIVDVFSFLQDYPYNQTAEMIPVKIAVEDDFLPENNCTYYLSKVNGRVGVSTEKPNELEFGSINCSVQYLTSMFLSYNRPTELAELQLIEGDKNGLQSLENLISYKQTYLPDFF